MKSILSYNQLIKILLFLLPLKIIAQNNSDSLSKKAAFAFKNVVSQLTNAQKNYLLSSFVFSSPNVSSSKPRVQARTLRQSEHKSLFNSLTSTHACSQSHSRKRWSVLHNIHLHRLASTIQNL